MTAATNTCDVCGKPATHYAQDIYQWDDGSGWLMRRPYNPPRIHAGCDEHRVESKLSEIHTSEHEA